MSMTHGEDYWRCKCGQVSLVNYHTQILSNVCGACARLQDGSAPFNTSPRHGFKCDKVPVIKGLILEKTMLIDGKRDYGAILDAVYDMAEDVIACNGVSVATAIENVLKIEGWKILPTHRKQIEARLA